MEKPNNFRKNLIRLRDNADMSQEQLAEKLGISRQSISKWESGEAMPEMKMLTSLCDIFKVSLDDLVRGEVVNKKVPLRQEYEEAVHRAALGCAWGVGLLALSVALLFKWCSLAGGYIQGDATNIITFITMLICFGGGLIIMSLTGSRFDAFRTKHRTLPENLYNENAAGNYASKSWPRYMVGGFVLTIGLILAFINLAISGNALQFSSILAVAVALGLPLIFHTAMIGNSLNIAKYNYNNSAMAKTMRKKIGIAWGIVTTISIILCDILCILIQENDVRAFMVTNLGIFWPIIIGSIVASIIEYRTKKQ